MSKKNVIEKDFTYFSVIKEAIDASPQKRATSAQIFEYMTHKYPSSFTESTSSTWKNNVRQLLSKCPEFVKTKKETNSKLHYWQFVPYERYYNIDRPRFPGDFHRNKEPKYEYKITPKYLQNYENIPPNQPTEMFLSSENNFNSSYYDDQINFNVNLPFFNPEYRDIYGRHSNFELKNEEEENDDSSIDDLD
ncbi:hypothetical protein H312_03057 [Anncaliia algerae PRA339]|uniref:Fork-head domain-containing protein n=1 Tax=Anncaliia algerae PRA339 TaxID=1288291 RepID=A0A059EXY4_9MICR|nr:hypothetical protein H312_03057 [Anncaliia algerae PRA339]